MSTEPIRYSRGAQFWGGRMTGLFLVLVALIFVLLSLASTEQWIAFLLFIPILTAFGLFLFDIRGVEIDLEKKVVREYRFNVFGRYGKWLPFGVYDRLDLDLDNYTVTVSDLGVDLPMGVQSIERHIRSLVTLTSSTSPKTIILCEEQHYIPAQRFAIEASRTLSLPVNDGFGERLRESKRRRGGRR